MLKERRERTGSGGYNYWMDKLECYEHGEIEAEWAIQRSLPREVSLVIATRFCNCGRRGAYILSWLATFLKYVQSKLNYETSKLRVNL